MKHLAVVLIALAAGCSRQDSSPERAARAETSSCPQGWLRYEPERVQIQGIVVINTRYGPPNYGENPDADEKLSVPFLALRSPISVCADSASDVNNENLVELDTLQLVSSEPLRSFAGQSVVVSGRLTRAVTGHHYTSAVLQADSLRPVR
jgi:hypothetical protein